MGIAVGVPVGVGALVGVADGVALGGIGVRVAVDVAGAVAVGSDVGVEAVPSGPRKGTFCPELVADGADVAVDDAMTVEPGVADAGDVAVAGGTSGAAAPEDVDVGGAVGAGLAVAVAVLVGAVVTVGGFVGGALGDGWLVAVPAAPTARVLAKNPAQSVTPAPRRKIVRRECRGSAVIPGSDRSPHVSRWVMLPPSLPVPQPPRGWCVRSPPH